MLNKLRYFFIKRSLKKVVVGCKNQKFKKMCKSEDDASDKFDILKIRSKSFSQTLLNFIDERNITDVDCYKKANIDRRLFSKIRSNEDYKPSKNTVFAFAISLKLTLEETNLLLISAGYSLSHSFITDIIVEYFIEKKKYDINLINVALNDYKQQPLGSF